MKDSSKIAQKFLNELYASKESIETLMELVNILETKLDPEMTEVRLVDNIHNFIEKLKTMEGNIRSYVKDSKKTLPGNKLTELYENISASGNIYRD